MIYTTELRGMKLKWGPVGDLGEGGEHTGDEGDGTGSIYIRNDQ